MTTALRWTGDPVWVLMAPDKRVVEVNIEPRIADLYAVGDQIEVDGEVYVLLEKRGRWLALVDEL